MIGAHSTRLASSPVFHAKRLQGCDDDPGLRNRLACIAGQRQVAVNGDDVLLNSGGIERAIIHARNERFELIQKADIALVNVENIIVLHEIDGLDFAAASAFHVADLVGGALGIVAQIHSRRFDGFRQTGKGGFDGEGYVGFNSEVLHDG